MSNLVHSMFEAAVAQLNEGAVHNETKATLDVRRIAKAYIRMRAERERLAREFDAADAAIKRKQGVLETAILGFLNETGQESARTDTGVFYKQEDITPTGADWEAFYDWVRENNAFDFLERRIKRTSVQQYMEDNGGATPPGVNVFRKYKVVFRKS